MTGMPQPSADLNTRLQTVLSQMDTITDISKIIYQVVDFGSAADMVLDTLTEYFKVSGAALLWINEDRSALAVAHHRNCPPGFAELFTFRPNDTINDQKLTPDAGSLIEVRDDRVAIGEKKLHIPGLGSMIYLLPLNCHEEFLGYLAVLSPQIPDDQLKVLQLLAAQISPAFHAFKTETARQPATQDGLLDRITDQLVQAKAVMGQVAFGLIRVIVVEKLDSIMAMIDLNQQYQKVLGQTFNPEDELHWLTPDTALVMMPGADLFQAESRCAKLKDRLEKPSPGDHISAAMTMRYACVSFPQVRDNAADILNNLWKKLFDELEAGITFLRNRKNRNDG